MDKKPKAVLLESHVVRWGTLIAAIIVAVGVMLILSSGSRNFTDGAGAAAPGQFAPETLIIKKELYSRALEEARRVAAGQGDAAELVKLVENLPY